jgi:hypothetical protein
MTLEIGKAYTIESEIEVFGAGRFSHGRSDICANNPNRCMINLHIGETVIYEGVDSLCDEFATGKFAVDASVIRTLPKPYAQWIIEMCSSETNEGMVTIYIDLSDLLKEVRHD